METLDDILADLLRREPIFHRPAFPTQMAENYFEIGASGQRYDRVFILQHLSANPAVDADAESWQITNPQLRALSADTFLLTYTLNQQPRLTQRSTIWRRAEGDWEILYHQGTLTGGDGGLSVKQ